MSASGAENLNADDVETVAEAMRALDKIASVGLHGSLMVDIDGRHVGYLVVTSDTEVTFSQKASS